MKQLINNMIYDTETSEQIYIEENFVEKNKTSIWKTRKGNYFKLIESEKGFHIQPESPGTACHYITCNSDFTPDEIYELFPEQIDIA